MSATLTTYDCPAKPRGVKTYPARCQLERLACRLFTHFAAKPANPLRGFERIRASQPQAAFQTERVSFYPSNSSSQASASRSGVTALDCGCRQNTAGVEITNNSARVKRVSHGPFGMIETLLTLVGEITLRFQDGPSVPKKRCKTASSESERHEHGRAFLLSGCFCLLPTTRNRRH